MCVFVGVAFCMLFLLPLSALIVFIFTFSVKLWDYQLLYQGLFIWNLSPSCMVPVCLC